MNITFTEHGWDDFSYWIFQDKKLVVKIMKLIKDIRCHPYEGIGKPEALKHELSGSWSRRINQEHRLVYKIDEEADVCYIMQCRSHY